MKKWLNFSLFLVSLGLAFPSLASNSLFSESDSKVLHHFASAENQTRMCPFCSSVNVTFGEQLKINDLVVTARLIEMVEPDKAEPTEQKFGRFAVKRIFKGDNFIGLQEQFEAEMSEAAEPGSEFLCFGIGPPLTIWSEAIPSASRVEQYLEDIQDLPTEGADRLAFFQDYFEDDLKVLAMDAYDEFAICSYEDLHQLKPRMPREKLMEFIQNPEIPENHRRLYFTMLGVCGNPEEDVPILERLLTSDDPADRVGLDSLAACYLCLKGAAGLDLIEQHFLLNEDTDYLLIHEIVAALRFHGTEVEIIPRQRLIQTVRLMLVRPRLADMVIADLARWEDWEIMDQLIEMFKKSDGKINWVRVPIFQYLMACPLPRAKEAIEELKAIDADALRRATFLSNLVDFEDEDDFDDDFDDDF